MPRTTQKIFVIGFPKTGTMSLGRALKALHYDLCPHVTLGGRRLGLEGRHTHAEITRACMRLVPEYDAFRNYPWSAIYKELDRALPEARFILTRRDSEAWMGSMLRHFGEKPLPISATLRGQALPPRGNEALYRDLYHTHNREVVDHFRDREDKLLVLDIEEADWDPLCTFLGRRRPLIRKFPHRNRGSFREQKLGRLEKVIRYNVEEFFGR